MDPKKIVWKETAVVAVGQIIFFALLCGVFAVLQKLTLSVVLGGIVGALLATGNFLFMAIGASVAADHAENSQDVKGGQAVIRNSYFIRLLVLGLILILCAKSGRFHLLALVLPLIFVRPTLTIAEFFRKKGNKPA